MRRVVLIVVFVIFWVSNSFSQEEEKKPDDTMDFYLKKGKGFEFHFEDDKYMFYIDFAEKENSRVGKQALDKLSKFTPFLKILGSYPRPS